MKRVVFVQPALPAYRVPFFRSLARAIQNPLEVWCDQRDRGSLPTAAADGFAVRHSPERTCGPFFSQTALLRAALARNIGTLIFPWNSRYLELLPAILLARLRGVRVLVWGHGYSKNESTAKRWLRNSLGRLASGVVLYSSRECARLLDEGFDKHCVFVAPNAIDRAPIVAAQRHLPVAAGSAANCQVILFSSRLEADKRPELLVAAFALVRAKVDARLIIIGDGPLRHQLEAQARRLGALNFIEFIGPEYDEARIAALMQRAAVFAYPAAIGLSLLHAFHYGLPVVTSDDLDGHNPEIQALVPTKNGATFRDGDIEDFARVLLEFLTNDPMRTHLAANALRTVTEPDGFTLDNMVRGMQQAISTQPPG